MTLEDSHSLQEKRLDVSDEWTEEDIQDMTAFVFKCAEESEDDGCGTVL